VPRGDAAFTIRPLTLSVPQLLVRPGQVAEQLRRPALRAGHHLHPVGRLDITLNNAAEAGFPVRPDRPVVVGQGNRQLLLHWSRHRGTRRLARVRLQRVLSVFILPAPTTCATTGTPVLRAKGGVRRRRPGHPDSGPAAGDHTQLVDTRLGLYRENRTGVELAHESFRPYTRSAARPLSTRSLTSRSSASSVGDADRGAAGQSVRKHDRYDLLCPVLTPAQHPEDRLPPMSPGRFAEDRRFGYERRSGTTHSVPTADLVDRQDHMIALPRFHGLRRPGRPGDLMACCCSSVRKPSRSSSAGPPPHVGGSG